MLPPICRARLKNAAAPGMSRISTAPSTLTVSGTKICARPRPLSASGQKNVQKSEIVVVTPASMKFEIPSTMKPDATRIR